jgi:hypothetical protein
MHFSIQVRSLESISHELRIISFIRNFQVAVQNGQPFMEFGAGDYSAALLGAAGVDKHGNKLQKGKISKTRVKKDEKPKITLTKFQRYLISQKGLYAACSTIPFTILLWIALTILTSVHNDIESSFETRTGITRDLLDRNVTLSNSVFNKDCKVI